MIRIGYACKIEGPRGYAIKSCRLGPDLEQRLVTMTRENLQTLLAMLSYNNQNGISLFRISSDVIPLGSHPAHGGRWWETEQDLLAPIGGFIIGSGMRVSMHPGQYTVLNSPDEGVAERAVADLIYHARFLDALGLASHHKIVLHIGGAYGDKPFALTRFVERARALPPEVLRRLVLENDDKIFGIEDVMSACHQLSLPAVFDTLHFDCNPDHSTDKPGYIRECAKTWKPADGPQKIHYSQQRAGAKRGMHSATISVDGWLADSAMFDGLDVMLEVKDKNLSAIKCDMLSNPYSRHKLEREWGRYKYLVMRHSQAHYLELRALMRDTVDTAAFFRIVDQALIIPPTTKTVRNAAQHIWGYFKRREAPAQFRRLLAQYEKGSRSEAAIFSYLYRLAVKWNEAYLLDGYSFM